MSFDSWDLKKVSMFGGRECQCLLKQRPERSPEPVVRGYVESDFLSLEDRRSELVAHQVSQDHLLPATLDLQARRQRASEFHDPMIEKRRPHFHRMSHAGAVDLRQDIVRQEVFLSEPEIGRQIVARASQFLQDGIERRRQCRLNQGALFQVVEGSAPMRMGSRRGHPAAF